MKLAVGRCLAAEIDNGGRWTELALLTDTEQLINSHPRLLRSLRFGDDDYEACVFSVVPDLLNERSDPIRTLGKALAIRHPIHLPY